MLFVIPMINKSKLNFQFPQYFSLFSVIFQHTILIQYLMKFCNDILLGFAGSNLD